MNRTLATATAMLLVGASMASAATSSDWGELEQRISTMETQMQRAPVPPLPIPSISNTKPAPVQKRIVVAQSAANLAVRVDRLENQMRIYNGQIEELNFRIRQMQEQLRRFQEDAEFRFQDLERGGAKKNRRKQSRAPRPVQPQNGQNFQQLGTPPQSLGNLNGSVRPGQPNFGNAANQAIGGSRPIDLSTMLKGGAAGPSATFPGSGTVTNGISNAPSGLSASLTGDPVTDYDQAYGLVLQGEYGQAEGAFRRFIAAYDSHHLAANAHYWIGESQFQRRDYRQAIETFLGAYSAYPRAQKAPDMLLRTGMALRQIREREAACATYEELLAKYPNASAGVRQKVRSEIRNAKC